MDSCKVTAAADVRVGVQASAAITVVHLIAKRSAPVHVSVHEWGLFAYLKTHDLVQATLSPTCAEPR